MSKDHENEYSTANVHVIPVPTSFYGWLDQIRQYPGRLQKKSLECLRAWLEGYDAAKQEAGLPQSAEEKEFEGFDYFVCARYNRFDNAGWSAKIAYYNQDDLQALDVFFKLLDEFRQTRHDLKPTIATSNRI